MAFSQASLRAYVAESGFHKVAIISGSTVLTTNAAGATPAGTAHSGFTNKIYAADSGGATVTNLKSV